MKLLINYSSFKQYQKTLIFLLISILLLNCKKIKEQPVPKDYNNAEITSVSPAIGKTTDTFTFRGHRLRMNGQCQINYVINTSPSSEISATFYFKYVSDTLAKGYLETDLEGPGHIEISNGSSGPSPFKEPSITIYRPELKIFKLNKTSYNFNDTVIIYGQGFSTVKNEIETFNELSTNSVATTRKIALKNDTNFTKFIMPETAPGEFFVRIKTQGKSGVSMGTIKINPPNLKISGLQYSGISPKLFFYIEGVGFNPEASKNIITLENGNFRITLGGHSINPANPTKLYVETPAEIYPQSYSLYVTSYGQKAKSPTDLIVRESYGAPTVTKLSTSSIKKGQTLNLTGVGLKGSAPTQVKFWSWPNYNNSLIVESVSNADGTSLSVIVPNSIATGTYELRIIVDGKYGFVKEILNVE